METDISSRRGFTLVETLIGIVVIAVLVTLTMGAYGRIRASMQNAKCLSNLRTLGTASLAYFAERNGELFTSKFWYQASWDAKPGMRDYAGITSREKNNSPALRVDTVFTCPHLKEMFPERFPSFLNRTYSMNYYLNVKNPSSAYNSDEDSRPLLAGAPHRMINVPKLSAMWMFTDGSSSSETDEFHSDSKPSYESLYMFFPHNGRQNVVFMDGHVESLTLEQFKNPASPREFWGNLNASK